LALIIAKVSGQPYEKFVQNSVLQPMGVTMHTITDAPQSAVQDYADGTEEDRIQFNPSAGWISTASDLYRFANRPIRGVEMSDLVPGEFDNQFFGLGWWIWRTPSEFIEYTHTGHLDGARAIMAVTSDGIVMAALFNGAEVPRSLERFAVIEHGLIAAIRKDAAVEKKALELKEERLRHIPKWCRDDWTRCRTRI
jgi:CubicO group peptidase (beta-lactamase class C family)